MGLKQLASGDVMSEALYSASGRLHNFEVYQPNGASKFYVRKVSKKSNKVIGQTTKWDNQGAAQREADRRAKSEGFV